MRISVIGSGHVGLVTGACLAEIGHHVVCTDSDQSKIRTLNAGRLPIYEPHLHDVVTRGRKQGRLSFTGDAGEAVNGGDVIFICVGTPPRESGDADLRAIDRAARLVATQSRSSKVVVEKSTVPAQTGRQLKRALNIYKRNGDVDFAVVSNPEFLREGTAVLDFMHPDRVVVGVEDPVNAEILREVYRPLLENAFHCPVHEDCSPAGPPAFIVTNIETAELIKHASNSFLALKVSYINLVADLCEQLNANVDDVARAMGLDPRIGPEFFRPGLGFGGFCLPKDIQAFHRLAGEAGVDFTLLKEVERINKQRIDVLLKKIRRALWVMNDKQVALLGLAYKPNTDDVRFSPAIELISRLQTEGVQVRAYDPEAIENMRALLPSVSYCRDAYEAAREADALVLVTEWDQFRGLDWQRIHDWMNWPLLFDGRNFLDPNAMKTSGFEYYSVGRPESDGMSPDKAALLTQPAKKKSEAEDRMVGHMSSLAFRPSKP